MATSSSGLDRRQQRRRETLEEALDHAVDVMTEHGVGALSVSEVARRTGMRGPSLYKYVPSLHALVDALFARGLVRSQQAVRAVAETAPPGLPRVLAGARALVRWAVEEQALAQLLFWRPIPGFTPSPEVLALTTHDMADLRTELRAGVELGQLAADADSDDALRLLTVLMSGLLTQQLANQPHASFETGDFTRLTDQALSLFVSRYAP